MKQQKEQRKINISRIITRLRPNRKHKDRLFQRVFADKKDLLDLYNAVNNTTYTNPDGLEITTLEDVIYRAYASLYKAYGETVDLIKADDVTVTLVRETKPEGLFRYFNEHNYSVSEPFKGVYYIKGLVLFPTQVIVTKELEWGAHIWLKSLSEEMRNRM